jgi:precorrin-6Y C5,15-methyltransferase (decarboxylating)
MPGINIIGAGPGNRALLTSEAQQAIERSQCLIGDKRVIEPYLSSGKTIYCSGSPEEILRYIASWGETEELAVLVSGDVGFYSLAKKILEQTLGDETRGSDEKHGAAHRVKLFAESAHCSIFAPNC